MKLFVQRYSVPIFALLTLIIGWIPWYTGGEGIIIVAPTIAGLLLALIVSGWSGVLTVLRRVVKWRVNIKWYLVVLLLPVVTSMVSVGIHLLLGGTAPQFPLIHQNQHLIALTFLFYLIPWQSSAFLEEIGLRGYAQEESQNRYGPLVGTLILGLIFGAWLLPEFIRLDSNQYAMGGLSFFPWFILTEVGWSVLMAWIYNKTGKSALVSGYLFHTAFNVWPFILLTNAVPGESLPIFDTTLFIINAVVVAIVAVIIIITTKGQLGFLRNTED